MSGVAYTLDDTSVIHLSSMSKGQMLPSLGAYSSNLQCSHCRDAEEC